MLASGDVQQPTVPSCTFGCTLFLLLMHMMQHFVWLDVAVDKCVDFMPMNVSCETCNALSQMPSMFLTKHTASSTRLYGV